MGCKSAERMAADNPCHLSCSKAEVATISGIETSKAVEGDGGEVTLPHLLLPQQPETKFQWIRHGTNKISVSHDETSLRLIYACQQLPFPNLQARA